MTSWPIPPTLPLLQGDSASKALLFDLNSRGWSVVDLAELARKAGVLEVVHILSDYCRGKPLSQLCIFNRETMEQPFMEQS